jgi:excisionase family DNA binding protein
MQHLNTQVIESGLSSEQTRALLGVQEAAAMLSLGRSSIYKLLDSGDLFSVYVFGRRLIPIDSIREFIKRVTEAEQEKQTAMNQDMQRMKERWQQRDARVTMKDQSDSEPMEHGKLALRSRTGSAKVSMGKSARRSFGK